MGKQISAQMEKFSTILKSVKPFDDQPQDRREAIEKMFPKDVESIRQITNYFSSLRPDILEGLPIDLAASINS
ncbi:MAG: hypothetical protein KAU36_06265, partial [candidate division Zixibacteria bacterium]|nr:hypothetical protein [candidate division Zixibacteria bacterium]